MNKLIDLKIEQLKAFNITEIIKNHGVLESSAKIIEEIKELERLKIKLTRSKNHL